MRQRSFIALIVPLLIVIGMWGQYQLSPANLTDYFNHSLYQVLGLFFLEGEWTLLLPEVPLAIDFVRFFAPMVAIGSFILVFAAATRISLINYGARFYRGHTVVVGLGEECWQFLRTCSHRDNIVVVARNTNTLLIERARELGVKVLEGDIFEKGMFERINLARASTLIAFTGNDGSNVELAIKARNHVSKPANGQPHMKIHIHLKDIGLANQLESYPKFFADYATTEISFFSVYDLSARLLLRDYPPEVFADVAGHEQVHLCIYGFDRLAEKLIIEAALLGHYANHSRLRLTIFDEDADRKDLKLRSEYPHLSKISDYEFVKLQTIGPHVFEGEFEELLPTITQHIVCMDTDEENLHVALMLRHALLQHVASNAPILVRMQHSSGLSQLLESNTGEPEIPDGLYPFGMLDQVLHADNILTSHLDDLAHSLHDMYLQSESAGDPRTHQALQTWNELPQWERKQNLLKADHWPVKLRAIRCRLASKSQPTLELLLQEVELQARMEHERYVGHKLFDGWHYGLERIEGAKINPYLIDWQQLPQEQREREAEDALTEPAFIAEHTGQYVQRTYVIGVTGHRLDKLNVDDEKLQAKVIEALEALKANYPDHHFIILSPLAEGADRLVASLAMRVLKASLQVPLPLPYDLYATDFATQASIDDFQDLVGRAQMYFEVPMKFGNIRALAPSQDQGVNEARNRQYALAGAYVVQRSDCLLAIYDGLAENGTGGTSQIVRWYNEGGIPPEYLYPSNFFLPPRKDPLIVINPNPAADSE
jgi:hypothetical protein